MEAIDKRYRIQMAAVQLFQEQGVESTSVNDIVKKANVAKGTFYVYYKDKTELISQILTKKHGCLMNDIMNLSYQRSQKEGSIWLLTFVEDIIAFYESNPDVLRMIQKNITNVMDTEEHRLLVLQEIDRLHDFLRTITKVGETQKQALTRFLLILQMVGFICFNSMVFQQPDTMKEIKPLLMNAVINMCD